MSSTSRAHGRELFVHAWTFDDPLSRAGDGLGPEFNGSSCGGCHNQGGLGGAGGAHGNTQIIDSVMVPREGNRDAAFAAARARLSADNDKKRTLIDQSFDTSATGPLGADLQSLTELLDLARPQVQDCLATLKITGPEKKFGFMRFSLQMTVSGAGVAHGVTSKVVKDKQQLACLEKALGAAKLPEASAPSRVTWGLHARETTGAIGSSGMRNPTALFGSGLVDAIDAAVIERAARPVDGFPEITGTVPRTASGAVGRFGWKGDVDTLAAFVTQACALEVGLEVPGRHQGGPTANAGLDLNASDVSSLTQFVRNLDKPRRANSKQAERGEKLFARVGCTACHVEQLGGVDGIYSDLVLHDMGASLADGGGYGGGIVAANDREWRTPPLWGVRDSGPWMHDGRSQSLLDAVQQHGGEAARVRSSFAALRDDEQRAVVSFLESLQAPL